MARLGTGRITLTDLTDVRPAKMDLATSLETLQSQSGKAYSPDYALGEGQVIIPSVFFGNEELASGDYRDKIIYNCSDLGDNVDFKWGGAVDNNGNPYETEIINGYPAYKSTYVDDEGCLHIRRNLEKSFVVEARVEDITDPKTGVIQPSINEAITLKKISVGTGYQLFIESTDNRWDFEVGGEQDIELTYKVYYDTEEVSSDVTAAQWYESGEEIKEDELTNKITSYIVSRNNVFGHETYRLAVKMNNGVILRASAGIDDRTDSFYGEIIAYGATYLSPKNNTLKLECQVWRNDNQFEFDNSVDDDEKDDYIDYEWYWLDKEQEGIERKAARLASLGGTKIIELSYENIEGKDVMVYCRATIVKGGKKVGYPLAKISVTCGENFNASLSRSVIPLPCYAAGNVKNENFSETITLTLADDAGVPLSYGNETDEFSPPTNDGNFKFSATSLNDSDKWIVSITLTKGTNFEANWDAKTYSISYKRKGASYVIPFEVIKVKQGENGTPGFTIDLTNQFHLFAGTDFGAYADQKVEIGYTALLADEDISNSLTKLEVDNRYNIRTVLFEKEENIKGEAEVVEGIYVNYNVAEKNITIRTKNTNGKENTYSSPERGEIMFYFTFQNKTTISVAKTFIKTFTYGINTSGNSFSLITDPTQIVYSPATSELNVDKITITARYQLGGKGPYLACPNATVDCEINDAASPKKIKVALTGGVGTLDLKELSTSATSYTFYYYIENNPSDEKVLVDVETVPVVTSMDGVEIGGENLLPYSEKFDRFEEEGKGWVLNDRVIFDEENDCLLILGGGEIISPTIMTLKNKKMCFSYQIEGKESLPIISLIFGEEEVSLEKELENPSWLDDKCYYLFNAEKDFRIKIKHPSSSTDEEASYLVFSFPKLELGNIPTAWSPDAESRNKKLKMTIASSPDGMDFITSIINSNTDDSTSLETYTISSFDENGEITEFSIIGADALQSYIKILNDNSTQAMASYTSSLLQSDLSLYKSSIDIQAAHLEGDAHIEGNITIKTSYIENDNTFYSEALKITSNEIAFMQSGKKVAYLSDTKLYINNGQITESLLLGPSDDSHIKIYTEADSIAIVWEE